MFVHSMPKPRRPNADSDSDMVTIADGIRIKPPPKAKRLLALRPKVKAQPQRPKAPPGSPPKTKRPKAPAGSPPKADDQQSKATHHPKVIECLNGGSRRGGDEKRTRMRMRREGKRNMMSIVRMRTRM